MFGALGAVRRSSLSEVKRSELALDVGGEDLVGRRSCTASRIRATMPLVIAALLSARKCSRRRRRHRIDPDRCRAAADLGRVGLERVGHRLELPPRSISSR